MPIFIQYEIFIMSYAEEKQLIHMKNKYTHTRQS